MDTSYQNWSKAIHSWSQKLLFTFKNVICVMFISQKTIHSIFSFLVNAIFLASSIQHFSLTVSSRVLSRFMMCLLVSCQDFGSWTHAIQTCITDQGFDKIVGTLSKDDHLLLQEKAQFCTNTSSCFCSILFQGMFLKSLCHGLILILPSNM